MLYFKNKRLPWLLMAAIIGVFFFIGGLGIEVDVVQYFGVLVGVLLVSLTWLLKRKIKLPRGIILYSLFLILFIAHSFKVSIYSKKSLEVFSLFFGGGLFWVAAYNLRDELRPYFDKIIIIFGLIFAGLYFFNNLFGDPTLVKPWSLYAQASAFVNHNHIGDLWAVVLTVAAFYAAKKPKSLYIWILIPLGVYLLVASQSRSAYVALAVGVSCLAKELGLIGRYKKAFVLFIVLILALFLYVGTQKSILFSRPYYMQAIVGFIRTPQGVGVGNFGIISKDPANHILGLSGFSSVAHNIVLEVMTGLGILGLVFVGWFIKILYELWKKSSSKELVYKATFFALTANFLFDTTYFIPVMLWLWFTALGLSQKMALG
ncbi:MAG: O-antigen ligase family protein [Patescibacteria group bacterium]